MIHHWQNPGTVARLIVERVKDGEIQTPGQWTSAVQTIGTLPDPVREWLFRALEKEMGSGAVKYISSMLPQAPGGVYG